MTTKDFEEACQDAFTGDLWDADWNADYHEKVSLTVAEMRDIMNLLRHREGLPPKEIKKVEVNFSNER